MLSRWRSVGEPHRRQRPSYRGASQPSPHGRDAGKHDESWPPEVAERTHRSKAKLAAVRGVVEG